MKQLKAALKALFCPPPLPAVLLAALGYGSVILVFALDIGNPRCGTPPIWRPPMPWP